MFFYDCFGGDKVGGVWLPGLRAPKPFKVRERYSSTPVHQVRIGYTSPNALLNIAPRQRKIKRGHWMWPLMRPQSSLRSSAWGRD